MRFWLTLGLLALSGCGIDPNLISNLTRSTSDVAPTGNPTARFQIRYEFGDLLSASGPDSKCIAIERATVEDMKKYQPIGPEVYRAYGSRLYSANSKPVGTFEAATTRFQINTQGAISGYSYEQTLAGAVNSSSGQWVSVGRSKDGSIACRVAFRVGFIVEKIYGVRKLSLR